MTDKLIILKELKQYLQCNYGTNVKEVILFGSQAAGTAVNYSDFDVLIVLENDYNYKDENNILDLCYDMDLKYNIIIDAHLISRKEINSLRGKQPIYINALNNGIYA
ncbi:MAG: nucleotidyltransferase domain-containing protein [Bacteroidetes bacterium]|nr:nucleotidyltransferase domain-containing protein [Bacteroidota bacterium]